MGLCIEDEVGLCIEDEEQSHQGELGFRSVPEHHCVYT